MARRSVGNAERACDDPRFDSSRSEVDRLRDTGPTTEARDAAVAAAYGWSADVCDYEFAARPRR